MTTLRSILQTFVNYCANNLGKRSIYCEMNKYKEGQIQGDRAVKLIFVGLWVLNFALGNVGRSGLRG